MRRPVLGIAAVLGVVLLSLQPAHATLNDNIRVMTRNQYLGADLTPVILAQTPEEFVGAATTALRQIAANDFPRRVKALALEVLVTRPDVIGLQEVFDFTVNGSNSRAPFVDHLELTLKAFSALGLHYVVGGTVEHLEVTLPIDVNGDGITELVGILDRDVILVRSDLPYTSLRGDFRAGGLCGVPIPNPVPAPPFPSALQSRPSEDGCTYTIVGVVNTPFGPITVERGFLGVDVTVRGKNYRVVNTHLEVKQPDPTNPGSAVVQFLQSVELAGTLAATTPQDRRLIALGDYNSSPVDVMIGSIPPPYQVMAAAGFADIWKTNTLGFLDRDGFTCCEQADLANKTSLASERIDLIFVRTGERFAPAAIVTGQIPLLPLFRAPNWASDHGGVFGALIFH